MNVLKQHPPCQMMKGQGNNVRGCWGKMHPTRHVCRVLADLAHTHRSDRYSPASK